MPFFARALGAQPAFEVPELDEEVRKIAVRAWEDRAHSEYIGVMVMRHFHGLLVDINAPMDLQQLALELCYQEQQHTGLCVAAARALGSESEISFRVAELQMTRDARPLSEQLLSMFCGIFATGEVAAASLISFAIGATPPSDFRNVLRTIARDEVMHAKLGPAFLGMLKTRQALPWIRYPGDTWVRETVRKNILDMRQRDVVERDEEAMFENPARAAQLLCVGIPPTTQSRQVYHRALTKDVPNALAREGIRLEEV